MPCYRRRWLTQSDQSLSLSLAWLSKGPGSILVLENKQFFSLYTVIFFFLYNGHINGHVKVIGHINGHIKLIKYFLKFFAQLCFYREIFQYKVYLLYGTVQAESDAVRKYTIHPLQVNCKTEMQKTARAKGLFWEPSWTSCSAKGLGILLSLVSDPKLQITKVAVNI